MRSAKWAKADAAALVESVRAEAWTMSDDDVQLIASVAHVPAAKVRVIVDLAEKRLREMAAR